VLESGVRRLLTSVLPQYRSRRADGTGGGTCVGASFIDARLNIKRILMVRDEQVRVPMYF
jgi:hypothetical protein